MEFAPIWSSLANAPPPPSQSEGATLCEMQALLVSLHATLQSHGAGDSETYHNIAQARLTTAEVLKHLPNVSLINQNKMVNTLDGSQHIYQQRPGRSAISAKRSFPRSTSMCAATGSAKSAFLSPTIMAPEGKDYSDHSADERRLPSIPVLKRIFSRWYQEGWLSAINDMATDYAANTRSTNTTVWQKVLASTASVLMSFYSLTSRIPRPFHSSLKVRQLCEHMGISKHAFA